MKDLLRLVALIALFVGVTRPGFAYVFKIDSLSIDKNASQYFQDSFDDGVPPPSSPLGPNAYYVTGSVGPEANGKLTLDENDAVASTDSTGQGELVQAVRGNTGIDGIDPGFYLGDRVSVTAIFDLVAPDAQLQGYGVRFTDSATGMGKQGSDLTQVRVRRTSLDTLQVQFVNASYVDGTFEIISRAMLDMMHDQIALMLDLDALGDVTASYSYLNGGIAGPKMTLGGTSRIFEGENWTRVEFVAQQTLVSEPATLALIALGLVGVLRRR